MIGAGRSFERNEALLFSSNFRLFLGTVPSVTPTPPLSLPTPLMADSPILQLFDGTTDPMTHYY